MNPAQQQGPENPFMKILEQIRSQGGQQAPGQQQPAPASALQQAQQAAGGPAGAQQPEIQDATLPGQNPGVSKNLMGAMSQLHGAITAMTDPREIQMLRNIIVMLTQLIQRDQEVQNQKTGSMAGQQPGDSNFGGDQGQQPAPPQPGQ